MDTYSFKAGEKDVLIVISSKYANWKEFLGENYIMPLRKTIPDIASRVMSAGTLTLASGKNPTKAQLKPHIEELLELCETQGIKTILCVDSQYFTYLTGKKFQESFGAAFKCLYNDIMVVPLLNAAVLYQQPAKTPMLALGLSVASAVINDEYIEKAFKFQSYEMVTTASRAKELLDSILGIPMIAYDIETTGLNWRDDEFISHGFAKDRYNAFVIVTHPKYTAESVELEALIKDFFFNYKGSTLVHNISFELRFLTYKYAMKSWDDYEGMSKFINNFAWEDTKLLGYAGLNSTVRTSLGLKDLAKAEYGDWDSDVDVSKALDEPIDKLSYYNAIDVSATWYLYETFLSTFKPEEITFYNKTMKPISNQFVKLMLTGYPIHMPTVLSVEEELLSVQKKALDTLSASEYVQEAQRLLSIVAADKYNASHVTTRRTPEECVEPFNPNSSNQLRVLLFDVMQYEVVGVTKTKQPSTDRDTLIELLTNQARNDEEKEVLEGLIMMSQVANIITTFISAMKNKSVDRGDGHYKIYGNLNLGSTVSFRPTANNINLLNAPSDGSKFGPLFKTVFKPRKGFIIAQVDYSGLQNTTAGNLTRDPNLIKVINNDYDMHSYHAYYYWREEITERMEAAGHPFEDTAEYFSKVKKVCADRRQEGKAVTFALMFGGSAMKVQQLLKCSMQEAELIYHRYHNELYAGVAAHGRQVEVLAKKQGYINIGTDGLSLRCPDIYSKDNAVVSSTVRSITNATIQYYDKLTLEALTKEQALIEEHGYLGKIIPHGTVYDSIYFEVEENAETIKWLNDTLIAFMTADYMEDQPIKLKANLDIGTSWKHHIELPNYCSLEHIKEVMASFSEEE